MFHTIPPMNWALHMLSICPCIVWLGISTVLFSSGIPKEHAVEFDESNDGKRNRLNNFKAMLQKDGVLVLNK